MFKDLELSHSFVFVFGQEKGLMSTPALFRGLAEMTTWESESRLGFSNSNIVAQSAINTWKFLSNL